MKTRRSVFLAAIVLLPFTTNAQLPQHEVLFQFTRSPHSLSELVRGSDGSFYATGIGGPDNKGVVVRITSDGTLSTLFEFNGSNGAITNLYSGAGLAEGPDGNFYGTTHSGGDDDYGTMFRITPDGTFSRLVSFNRANGSHPRAALTLGADGHFYGTTYQGGVNNLGTVFRVTTNGALTTIGSFDGANRSRPESVLTLGDAGEFYGTASSSDGYGIVFRMTTNGTLTTLASFNSARGRYPAPRLVRGPDGNFYGTTAQEGLNGFGYGTVFKITPAGSLTTLYSFDGFFGYGKYPVAGLTLDTDGSFLGTTWQGGDNNYGTVFRVTTNGTATTLVSFNNDARGSYPRTRLTFGDDGNLYGTTSVGGFHGTGFGSGGTVFRMIPGGTLTEIHALGGSVHGRGPNGLTLGNDGNLYGTTILGGAYDNGTVFRITPAGTLTTLDSFHYFTNGYQPYGGLALGSDGSFYGTTLMGGHLGLGSVFKVTPDGGLTRLVSFNATNGSSPYAELTSDGKGNFYGTTSTGGSFGLGTVFRLNDDGTLLTLVSFNGTNGARPTAGLTQGDDGNYYGTTPEGGARGEGTAFKMTPAGRLTTIASFAITNGLDPSGRMTLGNDGNFYGTTAGNSSTPEGANYGTVFKLTPDGALTTFHAFRVFTNGAYPATGLTLAPDGNFYGTTSEYGTLFKLAPDGTLTTLVSFDRLNEGQPRAGLTLGDDGHLYGTTSGLGTIFRIRTGFPKGPSIITQPASQQTFTGASVNFTVSATTANPPLRYQWRFNFADLPGATNDTLSIPNAQPTNVGAYRVVVTDKVGSARSEVVSLDLLDALFITTQPADLAVNAGSTATFTVAAYGAEPLRYQWRLNGENLDDATNDVLRVTNVQAAQLGEYTAVISNLAGSVTSRVASLILNIPPTIIRPPESQTVIAGDDVTFTVVATNTATLPIGFIWRKDIQFTNFVLNDRTGSLTLFNVATNVTTTNGPGTYRVVLTNAAAPFNSPNSPNVTFVLDILPATTPTAATLAATDLTATSATLDASVNPMGAQTSVWFDYGLTPAYGSRTTAVRAGNASSPVTFSQVLTGLSAATTYHYRVVATNYGGMSLGSDITFITTAAPPRPTVSGYTRLPDGRFRLQFDGVPGTAYTVLCSTNLPEWILLGPATETAPGAFEFIDTDASGHSIRFYKLRSP